MGTLTMKFGGSSVGTTAALTQVIGIVLQEHERWDRLVVIASALEGVTDALLEAAHLAQLANRRGYRRIVATVRTRHLSLVEQLPLGHDERSALLADIDQLLFEMLDVCQSLSDPIAAPGSATASVDAVIGFGERLAARIIAAMLRDKGLRGVAVDTTQMMITNDAFGNAIPDTEKTSERIQQDLLPMLERGIIPVVTGFIGGTPDGQPTTLGRGGSDYTSSLLAIFTESDEVWIWSNVDGMMSTDPRQVDAAQVIPELSYTEAAELAYFGARVLHARMISPLQEHAIPLRIKNVFKPGQPGTLIHSETQEANQHIKAVTGINGVGLRSAQSGPLDVVTRVANVALEDSIGSRADVMLAAQTPGQSFLCFVIPTSAGPDAVHTARNSIAAALESADEDGTWHIDAVNVVTVIGADINQYPHMIARVFDALDNVPLLAVAQGPSGSSFSLVVAPQHAQTALERVHTLVE